MSWIVLRGSLSTGFRRVSCPHKWARPSRVLLGWSSMNTPGRTFTLRSASTTHICMISSDASIALDEQTRADDSNEPKYVGVVIAVGCEI